MKDIVQKRKIMEMRLNGFTRAKAKWWLSIVEYDELKNDLYTLEQKRWAYDNGYLPEFVQRFGIDENNVEDNISLYDYCAIYPVNDIFRKWLQDRVTTRKVLKPYAKNLPCTYFHLYERDMAPMIIRLEDCPNKYDETFEGVIQLIKDLKVISFAKTKGYCHDLIRYQEDKFFFNDECMTEDELIKYISKLVKNDIYVIIEYVQDESPFASSFEAKPNLLRLMVYNKYGDNPKIGQAYLRLQGEDTEFGELKRDVGKNRINLDENLEDNGIVEDQILLPKSKKEKSISRNYYCDVDLEDGSYNGAKYLGLDNKIIDVQGEVNGVKLDGVIPFWQELNDTVKELCMFIPQMELMGIDVVITHDGFKFVDFTDQPYYPQVISFNEEMTGYFKMKISQKKELVKDPAYRKTNIEKRKNNFIWTRLTKLFSPPEMRPLIYKWWYVTVKEDLFSRNGISLKDKYWAYKHGFLSYRLPQYGITKENFKNFISDYDYRYLRHINNKYRIWLEDKLTVKYICDKHSEFFPEYYYHFSVRNGEQRIIALMDLPEYCDTNIESIFKLVENVGALACKPQRGSQGEGFYKLSYEEGKYYLNHKEATKDQIVKILSNPEDQYFITEYIQQHEVINKIYPGAVNTMRIITFMKDGRTTEIGNAYLRFGSKKTGAVDNMGAGGMFVQVDMETGRFYNGKIITENSILPCSNHPDTGELIEGYIPNWDIIKEGIIALNKDMPQLEYLGFDVAITQNGMKLPEINRAPGYPKIETFSEATIDYLLYKREMKMKRNNISKTKW